VEVVALTDTMTETNWAIEEDILGDFEGDEEPEAADVGSPGEHGGQG
jgi:hypothetical protein